MLSGLLSRAIFVGGAALVGTWQYRNYQMKSNHLTEVPNHIPTTSIIQAETIKKQFNYVDSFVAPVNGKWIESVDQYAKEFFGHTPRVVQLLLDSKRTIQSLAKNERVDCDLGEGKAAFLVRSRSEKEIVLGYDDKLFDVRISFLMDEKQQPQLMADTRQSTDNKAVTISTVVHVKGLLGKVVMWPLAWCQKMILPSWIIQTYSAHQEIKAAQTSA